MIFHQARVDAAVGPQCLALGSRPVGKKEDDVAIRCAADVRRRQHVTFVINDHPAALSRADSHADGGGNDLFRQRLNVQFHRPQLGDPSRRFAVEDRAQVDRFTLIVRLQRRAGRRQKQESQGQWPLIATRDEPAISAHGEILYLRKLNAV